MPQRATAESPQARHEVQHQERRRCGRAQFASAIDQPGEPFAALDPSRRAGRQQPCHFLDPWMEEFGDPEDLVIAGPRLAAHPVEPSRAGLEIRHADHVVIGHRNGEIFGKGLHQADCVARHRLQPVEIFAAIGCVLIIDDALQAGGDDAVQLCRQLPRPRDQRVVIGVADRLETRKALCERRLCRWLDLGILLERGDGLLAAGG
jgi:hypothetical protein